MNTVVYKVRLCNTICHPLLDSTTFSCSHSLLGDTPIEYSSLSDIFDLLEFQRGVIEQETVHAYKLWEQGAYIDHVRSISNCKWDQPRIMQTMTDSFRILLEPAHRLWRHLTKGRPNQHAGSLSTIGSRLTSAKACTHCS